MPSLLSARIVAPDTPGPRLEGTSARALGAARHAVAATRDRTTRREASLVGGAVAVYGRAYGVWLPGEHQLVRHANAESAGMGPADLQPCVERGVTNGYARVGSSARARRPTLTRRW